MAYSGISVSALADISLKAFADEVSPLAAFSQNFSDASANRGDGIKTRIIADSDAAEFGGSYSALSSGVSSEVLVPLDKHFAAVCPLNDVDASKSGIDIESFFKQVFETKIRSVARKCVYHALGKFTVADYGAVTVTSAASAFDRADIKLLNDALDTGKCPKENRNLIMNNPYYSQIAYELTGLGYNYGDEAIRDGKAPRVNGFDLYPITAWPTNASNIVGAAIHPSSLAVAMRPVWVPSENTLLDYAVATDPMTGVSFDIKRLYDANSGNSYLVAETLFGAVAAIKTGTVAFVASA